MKSSLQGMVLAAALSAGCNDHGQLNIPNIEPSYVPVSPSVHVASNRVDNNFACRASLVSLIATYRTSLERENTRIQEGESQFAALEGRIALLETPVDEPNSSLIDALIAHRSTLRALLRYRRTERDETQAQLDHALAERARCSDGGQ